MHSLRFRIAQWVMAHRGLMALASGRSVAIHATAIPLLSKRMMV